MLRPKPVVLGEDALVPEVSHRIESRQPGATKGMDMYARIASFKGEAGMDPEAADRVVEAIRSMVQSNWDSPPEGLENVKEQFVLVDREGGNGLGITLYDTEDDMKRGDEALNAMSPPDTEAAGSRTNVAMFEVAVHLER